MGFLSATTSLTRYRVEGKLEDPVMDSVYSGLRRNTISDIDENVSENAAGWTSFREPFVPSFEGSNFCIGNYFLFSLRMDRKTIPSKVIQKYYAIEYAKKLKASGREFFSKNEKKMLKEHVISLLTLRIPATPNIYDLLWSYEDASLWFFTNLKKPCEELETLFLTSFNLKLIRLFPYTMTEFFGGLTADEYETFISLTPTTLME
jgi:recombination associated protein RdgC